MDIAFTRSAATFDPDESRLAKLLDVGVHTRFVRRLLFNKLIIRLLIKG